MSDLNGADFNGPDVNGDELTGSDSNLVDLKVKPDCVSVTTLTQYYAGLLDDDASDSIDSHLFTCEACHALSLRMADLTQEYLEADEVPEQPPLLSAIAPETSDYSKRLSRLMQSGSELAAKIRIAARSITYSLDGLEHLVSPATSFHLPMAAAATSGRGHEGTQALQGAILEVPGDNDLKARILVDIRRQKITVQIESLPDRLPAPLVSLQSPNETALILEMERLDPISGEEGVVDCVAEFDMRQGSEEFVVLIEAIDNE